MEMFNQVLFFVQSHEKSDHNNIANLCLAIMPLNCSPDISDLNMHFNHIDMVI